MEDGTYNKDRQPVSHESGYQVGLWTKTTNAENMQNVIDEITNTWSGEWGIWTDSDTGEVFIEPCIWFADPEVAIAYARKMNQICVWDWALMQEVML
jgi:hypothetical protein